MILQFRNLYDHLVKFPLFPKFLMVASFKNISDPMGFVGLVFICHNITIVNLSLKQRIQIVPHHLQQQHHAAVSLITLQFYIIKVEGKKNVPI